MLQYCIHLSCCIFTSFNVEIEKKRACVANTLRMCDCPVSTTLHSCFLLLALDRIALQTTTMRCLLKRRQRCRFPVFSSWAHTSFTRRRVDERGERQAKLGHTTLLEDVYFPLSVAHSTYLSQPLSSTCSWRQLCCVARVYATHRVSVSNVVRAERGDLHAVIEYYFNSSALLLHLSPSCYFYPSDLPQKRRSALLTECCRSVVLVCLLVKHHVVQLVTMNIDDSY